MKRVPKPTLTQVLSACFVGLVVMLGLLFHQVLRHSGRSILESADRNRDEASSRIAGQVSDYLSQAEIALSTLESWMVEHPQKLDDIELVRTALHLLLLANDHLTEITLIHGRSTEFSEDGLAVVDDPGRGRISVFRRRGSDGRRDLFARHVRREGSRFVSYLTNLPRTGPLSFDDDVREPGVDPPDPTLHPTFTTPSARRFRGRTLWSDLHWSELDAGLPEEKKPIRVSVQKAVVGTDGRLVGVLRVGLGTEEIDRIVRAGRPIHDPHLVFITDSDGRLVTRVSPDDRFVETDGSLRVVPTSLPPVVSSALALSTSAGLSRETPISKGRFTSGDEAFLATFRSLGETHDWHVGIVAPERYYLGELVAIRNRLLTIAMVVMVCIVAAGSVLVRAVRRAQRQIVAETRKMNEFVFTAAPVSSVFSDVEASLESLERAKTAMRAMGKYAPIDLVRRLYQLREDPSLGGEDAEITLMFTDVEDFTAIGESLTPNQLAEALGRYLEAMVGVIQHQCGGTIDKFIGDAIMAMWNAPTRTANHAALGCSAALACLAAGRALAGSPAWGDVPEFRTRIGLHTGTVTVGHFGAPDRMNFTAVGDGVNLASRLEGLNKIYGTSIIASHTVQSAAGDRFVFRLLDRVAVVGRSQGVEIYELLGARDSLSPAEASTVRAYEEAFGLYAERRFREANDLLAERADGDAPSAVLAARCRRYLETPPSEDWNGIYRAPEK